MTGDFDVKLKRPVFATIEKGKRYRAHIRKGGEFKMVGVVAASAPYRADFGKGRKAFYVDVFGWGYTGRVLASKLREVVVVKENRGVAC